MLKKPLNIIASRDKWRKKAKYLNNRYRLLKIQCNALEKEIKRLKLAGTAKITTVDIEKVDKFLKEHNGGKMNSKLTK